MQTILYAWDTRHPSLCTQGLNEQAELFLAHPATLAHVHAAFEALDFTADQAPETPVLGGTLLAIKDTTYASASTQLAVLCFDPATLTASESSFAQACDPTHFDPQTLAPLLLNFASHAPCDHPLIAQSLAWSLGDLVNTEADASTLDHFCNSLTQAYEETQLLYRLGRQLNTHGDPIACFADMAKQMREVTPFSWLALRMADDQDITELAQHTLLAGHFPGNPDVLNAQLDDLLEVSRESCASLLEPTEHPLAKHVSAEVLVHPIRHDGQLVGVLAAGNKTADDPEVSSFDTQFLDAAADFLSVFHQNLAHAKAQHRLFVGTITALSASIDAKDPYTQGHSERVSHLGVMIAKAIGMQSERIERLRISGLLHDVGKIGVPESVLCKPSRLTDDEFNLIKRHPAIGADILRDIPHFDDVIQGVLYHHERYDGKGYPHGKAGHDTPIFGRILAVADAFDAMSSSRAYRTAMPREKVRSIIESERGSQFDPDLADAFLSLDLESYDRMLAAHCAQDRFDAEAA